MIFRLHLPTKNKKFDIKIYKTGDTCDMEVHIGKDSHTVATSTAMRVEEVGHNLQVEQCCSSPAVIDT